MLRLLVLVVTVGVVSAAISQAAVGSGFPMFIPLILNWGLAILATWMIFDDWDEEKELDLD